MKVYRSIQREPTIWGISLFGAGILICLFMLLFLFWMLLRILCFLSAWYLYGVGIMLVGFYTALRHEATMGQPNYLLSWISFWLFQPTNIDHHG